MSSPDPAEAPLSPEAKALIARARRSFLFSMGVLLVGFMVIAGVLVYRSTQSAGSSGAGAYGAAAMVLPAGSELLSASAAGGQVTLTVRRDGATWVRIHDGQTGALLSEIQVVSQ